MSISRVQRRKGAKAQWKKGYDGAKALRREGMTACGVRAPLPGGAGVGIDINIRILKFKDVNRSQSLVSAGS